MIDTHCHLTDPRLLSQLADVLARAAERGVAHMVTIATDPPDWTQALALCRGFPTLRCALGVHPNEAHKAPADALAVLEGLLGEKSVVALGEIGLDWHYGIAHREIQYRLFERQLAMAAERQLPVVIHSRESVADCLAVMSRYALKRAVFHCFTGSGEEAEQILAQGFWLGFTGVVTFKNGAELRRVAASVPADRLLVETDAPYLTPEPMRKQKVNEPAMVAYTAAVIARERGVSAEALAGLTTGNGLRFYGIG